MPEQVERYSAEALEFLPTTWRERTPLAKVREDCLGGVVVLACLLACLIPSLPACMVPHRSPPASCFTRRLSIPIDDDHKFTVNDYREKLYQQVVANRKDKTSRMAAYFGVKR